MGWKQAVRERQEVFLATSSKGGNPHGIIVLSLGLLDEKLLIGACLMKTSLDNILKNNRVSLVVKNEGEYFRIEGRAEVHSTGIYFDRAYKKSKPPMPKSAITIDITEVFDLGKQKIVLQMKK